MSNVVFKLRKLPKGPDIVLAADLTVGRGAESGLRLVEGSPSRKHAALFVSGDAVWVEDLGSTNGTFVNDQRISSRVKLKADDRVRFDVEEYQFRVESDAALADKTVMRAAVAPEVVAPSGRFKRPSGWVDDPDAAAGNKTRYMTREEMEEERKRLLASGARDRSVGRIDAPMLIVPDGPEGSLRVLLKASGGEKKEWTIGSEGERDILIKRVGVSALHAKIVNEGRRWKVVDQLSANGTFVNGQRSVMSFLTSGDRIAFGTVECIFQLPKEMADGREGGTGTGSGGGGGGGGGRLKKILVILGISFAVTLVALVVLASKFGWL